MSEMIERVARAMAKVNDDLGLIEEFGRYDVERAGGESVERIDYLAMARAAIEAMRESTDSMLFAGCSSLVSQDQQPPSVRAAFGAMIDAALAP